MPSDDKSMQWFDTKQDADKSPDNEKTLNLIMKCSSCTCEFNKILKHS